MSNSALVVDGLDDLRASLGKEVVSEWKLVDQDLINAFAATTGDHQFIHVDPERAAGTPMGGTIAHGLLTLSLGPGFDFEMLDFRGFAFGFNYGYDRIRFPAPVPSGSRVGMRSQLTSIDEVSGGVQLKITKTFECDQAEKPVCVAEQLVRLYNA